MCVCVYIYNEAVHKVEDAAQGDRQSERERNLRVILLSLALQSHAPICPTQFGLTNTTCQTLGRNRLWLLFALGMVYAAIGGMQS